MAEQEQQQEGFVYDPKAMDEAAKAAESELKEMIGKGILSGSSMTLFFQWYAGAYLGAGHKRLGRLFVRMAKESGYEPG